MTYPIGMDVAGAVMHTYRVFGIPTYYFIDRKASSATASSAR